MLLVFCSRFQLFIIFSTFYVLLRLPRPILCRISTDTCFIDHTSQGCFEYIARHRFLNANATLSKFRNFEQLIREGAIWLSDCPYDAINMAVGCWAQNRRLMPLVGGCDCAACGNAPAAETSPRMVELFCSPPSEPATIIQTVQPRTTEEYTTMLSLLMLGHNVSSVVPIWLHQLAWPFKLVTFLFLLLIIVCLALLVVWCILRNLRRPKYIVRRTYRGSWCSSIGGEAPIEEREVPLLPKFTASQTMNNQYSPTGIEVSLYFLIFSSRTGVSYCFHTYEY